MSFSSQASEELHDLLDLIADGDLSEGVRTRLNLILRGNLDLQIVYLEYLGLHAALAWDAIDRPANLDRIVGPLSAAPVTVVAKPARHFRQLTSRVTALAASLLLIGYFVALAGLLVWDRIHPRELQQHFAVQSPSGHFAKLIRTENCQWNTDLPPAAVGEWLSGPEISLRAGIAEVQFADGTTVHVQGPSTFEFRSPNSGFLRHGKLIATVPTQAIGFTIDTPTAEIVDLGTEFGVEVEVSGTAEVHVFQGRVAAQFNGKENQASRRVELKASESARFVAGETTVKKLAVSAEQFLQKPLEASPQLPTNQPDSVPGLQLWLKADAGVYSRFTDDGDDTNDTLAKPGDSVQGWRDFSGRGRHALQVNADHRPALQLNMLHSPVLRFDGIQWLERSGVVLNPADPSSFTIMVAFEAAAMELKRSALLESKKSALFGQYSEAGDTSRYFCVDESSASLMYDEFRPHGGYLRGEKGSVTINVMYIGTLVRNGDAHALHLATFGRGTVSNRLETGEKYSGDAPVSWRVGTRWNPTDLDAFRGEISEIIIYDRALSQSERHNIEKYLTPKLFTSKPQTAPK